MLFLLGLIKTQTFSASGVKRIILQNGYGMEFVVTYKIKSIPVIVPGFVAHHQIYGVLFALATADVLGLRFGTSRIINAKFTSVCWATKIR